MALILEMLSVNDDMTLAQIVSQLPKYHCLNNKFKVSHAVATAVIEKLAIEFSNYNISRFDGLKIELPDAVILLRQSNTEQILRLQIEAVQQEKAEKLFADMTDLIEKIITKLE